MNDLNSEQTLPPARTTRFDRAVDLFQKMPHMAEFISVHPTQDEGYRGFIERLRTSKTPEDAIVFMAFALDSHMAVRWGMEFVLSLSPDLTPEDTQLINWISEWVEDPTSQTRWKMLQMALFAPRCSPAVYLGLAVGWSAGPLAPNDLVTVPTWRTPQAISTAILRAIGQEKSDQRAGNIAQALERATEFLRQR
jgi:hypothetical protein